MNNSVLFLAGGLWQKPFVEYLKNKGHFVAVVNPTVTTTTNLADYHIRADVNDLDEINKNIEKIRPLFITSDQSDISTFSVAKLSEMWGLPGNNVNVIEKLTNKFVMFMFGKSVGVPVPETSLVTCANDVVEFAIKYGFPIVIKPIDATMSRGFRRIDSFHEITDDVFDCTLNFSKSKKIIAQKFVIGDMITLEGVCSGGRHRTIATSIKDGFFKYGINSGLRYPCKHLFTSEILKTNDRYVEEAGMKFGFTHAEYIVNDDEYWLIEIAGRGGGAGITNKIVPWVSGINIYDIFYESLMGGVVDIENIDLNQRPALLKYYQKEEVKGFNETKLNQILNIAGVADFHYDFIGKQYINDSYDTRHTMGIYLADTEEKIDKLASRVSEILQSQSNTSMLEDFSNFIK